MPISGAGIQCVTKVVYSCASELPKGGVLFPFSSLLSFDGFPGGLGLRSEAVTSSLPLWLLNIGMHPGAPTPDLRFRRASPWPGLGNPLTLTPMIHVWAGSRKYPGVLGPPPVSAAFYLLSSITALPFWRPLPPPSPLLMIKNSCTPGFSPTLHRRCSWTS